VVPDFIPDGEGEVIVPADAKLMAIKPMNCPAHVEVFKSGQKSYRDLPLRLAEFGCCHRNEPHGALHGIMRVRQFTQDDAHIFCTPDQVRGEFINVVDIVTDVLNMFGFEDVTAQISLRDPQKPEKYIGTEENWQTAEQAIIDACKEIDMKTVTAYGEAAFYGPKLDFMVRDAIGRQWQLGTVQVDYNLPERFALEYIGSDNKPHRPVMIHRAPFGSLERFTSILIEHTGGKFHLWLAPEQIALLPISDRFNDYCVDVEKELAKHDIRGFIDSRNETIGRKIRDTELKRVPFMLVVGEKEATDHKVAVRLQGEGDQGAMGVSEFVSYFKSKL